MPLAISFPESLSEQQRIVALLDEAFAGLATAKANAERNIQNARAVFESHLAVTFSQRGVGWAEMSLEAVVDPSCSLSYGIVQPGEDYLDGLPIVRPTDLGANLIHLDGLKRIEPKLAEGYRRTTLQGGELLLCVRGSTGIVSIAAPELRGANVTRGIVPIRFNSAYVLPELGYYLMKSEHVQSQIREKTYGAALTQVNIRDLRTLTLFVPSLKEQSLMALTMSELDTEVQRLTHIYERKLAALEDLKKSLLYQAFNGEL
jgi:type I restriction enzyme S subunit